MIAMVTKNKFIFLSVSLYIYICMPKDCMSNETIYNDEI
jgi:hypothetical protein